jgi:hypothetical protein
MVECGPSVDLDTVVFCTLKFSKNVFAAGIEPGSHLDCEKDIVLFNHIFIKPSSVFGLK